MELYYELLAVYSPDPKAIKKATELCNELIESGYLEDDDVMEVAEKTNSVISMEVEQDDGYMEFIIVNNKGELKYTEMFSLEILEKVREQIYAEGLAAALTKKDIKEINNHCEEHGISHREFLDEYLDELLVDKYEEKKDRALKRMKNYFIE